MIANAMATENVVAVWPSWSIIQAATIHVHLAAG
jgi:hypothetical protein